MSARASRRQAAKRLQAPQLFARAAARKRRRARSAAAGVGAMGRDQIEGVARLQQAGAEIEFLRQDFLGSFRAAATSRRTRAVRSGADAGHVPATMKSMSPSGKHELQRIRLLGIVRRQRGDAIVEARRQQPEPLRVVQERSMSFDSR